MVNKKNGRLFELLSYWTDPIRKSFVDGFPLPHQTTASHARLVSRYDEPNELRTRSSEVGGILMDKASANKSILK